MLTSKSCVNTPNQIPSCVEQVGYLFANRIPTSIRAGRAVAQQSRVSERILTKQHLIHYGVGATGVGPVSLSGGRPPVGNADVTFPEGSLMICHWTPSTVPTWLDPRILDSIGFDDPTCLTAPMILASDHTSGASVEYFTLLTPRASGVIFLIHLTVIVPSELRLIISTS